MTRTLGRPLAFSLLAAAGIALGLGLLPPGAGPHGLGSGIPAAEAGIVKNDPDHVLEDLRLFNSIVLLVNDRYVDPDRVRPKQMLLSALDYVEKRIAEVLVDESDAIASGQVTVTVGTATRSFDISRVETLWDMSFRLKDVFAFIGENLVSTEDTREIEYAAINGMLATLDPHSNLLDPEQYTDMKMHTSGEFGGLGFVVSMRDGKLTVMKVLKKTPAHRGGIKARDVITRIEDESTVNMDLTEAVKRLRGKPGSKVNFFIDREGFSTPRRFTLTRDRITIDSIDPVKLLSGNVGYIRVSNFQGNTTRDLRAALLTLGEQAKGQLKGVVLDLRGNPGGLLDQAIQVADLFVSDGTIVSTVGMSNKLRERKFATTAGTIDEIPLVVLVNNGSASASEIVGGAIKNLDRGLVVGSQTFGKGSVQVLYPQFDDSALKLTIAEYLTPGDLSIQEVGVTPDIELVPALVSKTRVMLFGPRTTMRESDLEEHMTTELAGAAPGAGAVGFDTHEEQQVTLPEASLTFLRDDVPEGEEIDEFEEPEWKEDFHIRFARELITEVGSTSRRAMLDGAKKVITQRTRSEKERIDAAVAGLGVDWTAAPEEGEASAAPEVTATLEIRGKALAGEKVHVVVTVKNLGSTPLHRVRAWTDSTSPRHVHYSGLFDHLEFPIGRLDPGRSETWSVPMTLPDDLPAREELVDVVVRADAFAEPRIIPASFSLAENPQPRYSFAWMVDDSATGNGDGRLSPGEDVALQVAVTNTGEGNAPETVITLKNLEDEKVYITRGRHHAGALASKATTVATMNLDLKGGYERPEVKMRVIIYDRKLGESISDDIAVPVLLTPAPSQKVRGAVRLDADADVIAWPSEGAPTLARVSRGARLPVSHQVDDHYRVTFATGRQGFVPVGSAKLLPKPVKRPLGDIALNWPHEAPVIELVGDPRGVSTDTEEFSISGVASDQTGLRDLYVFLNNQKVYFKAHQGQGAARIPFATTLRLEEGANTLMVFARENDSLLARRTVVIYRRPSAIAKVEGDPGAGKRETAPGSTP